MNRDPTYHPLIGFKNCKTWKDFVLAFNKYIAKQQNIIPPKNKIINSTT